MQKAKKTRIDEASEMGHLQLIERDGESVRETRAALVPMESTLRELSVGVPVTSAGIRRLEEELQTEGGRVMTILFDFVC